jgi:hypothetical protein
MWRPKGLRSFQLTRRRCGGLMQLLPTLKCWICIVTADRPTSGFDSRRIERNGQGRAQVRVPVGRRIKTIEADGAAHRNRRPRASPRPFNPKDAGSSILAGARLVRGPLLRWGRREAGDSPPSFSPLVPCPGIPAPPITVIPVAASCGHALGARSTAARVVIIVNLTFACIYVPASALAAGSKRLPALRYLNAGPHRRHNKLTLAWKGRDRQTSLIGRFKPESGCICIQAHSCLADIIAAWLIHRPNAGPGHRRPCCCAGATDCGPRADGRRTASST